MTAIVLGVATGAIYGLVAVGIVLVYKASRILNFAQAEFGGLALYLVWELSDNRSLPYGLSAVTAIGAMALLGIAFERVVVRRMGEASKVSLAVATVGLQLLLFSVELKVWGPAPKLVQPILSGTGITAFGFILTPTHLLALVILAVLGVGIGFVIARTRLGLGLLAVAEDPSTARLMGVPYHRISAGTWAVSGALGAVAGLLIGPLLGAFGPLSLSTSMFVPGLAAALLGGLTSLPGAFVGGLATGVVEAALKTWFPSVVGVGTFGMLAVIMLVLMFRPRGLLGRSA